MKRAIINEEFLQQVEALQTLIKNNVAGLFGGTHKSKTFGSSCEFSDYRDYVPGDDITKIDWNAYARFDKLYEKLFYDDRQMHTRIYVDTSRSMAHGANEKGASAIRLAAALAYLSVCDMDRVSVLGISDSRVTPMMEGVVGKESFYNEVGKLNLVTFDGASFISDAIMPEDVGYGDGLSVIISDFLTDADYESAINHLVSKRRQVLCIQILTEEELDPTLRGRVHLFDSEDASLTYRKNIDREIAEAYRAAVKHVTDRIAGFCHSRGAEYLLIKDSEDLGEIIFGKLFNLGVLK